MEKRKSNIELLRAFLAYMVIILHFNHRTLPGGGGGASMLIDPDSYRFTLMQFTESLCCCAVNVFVLISGYFMAEKKTFDFNKMVVLFSKLTIYNILFYAARVCFKLEPFNFKTAFYSIIPTNYYIMLYAVLLVLVPFLNKMINSLFEKQFDMLIIAVCVVFLAEPTTVNFYQDIAKVSLAGVNTYSINGDEAGYTIVHFVVMYLIGVYIKKKDFWNNFSAKFYFAVYLISSIIVLLFSKYFQSIFYYNNVFVVVQAIALFKFFDMLKIRDRKTINTLGSFSLDIFVIHTNTLFMFYFWGQFQIAVHYSTLEFWKLIPFTLITTLSMYVACLAIAVVYRLIFKRTEKFLLKRIKKIDVS